MPEKYVPTVSPREADEKMKAGVPMLDVREYPEWVEDQIAGATLIPLGDVQSDPKNAALGDEVLVVCKTGKRASEAAQILADGNFSKPYIVEGGIKGWQSAGLPTYQTEDGPISMERQVRIGAGALVLTGLLFKKARPLSYFVACGLIFAGVTNFCGMAKVLAKMPWNHPRGDEKERSLQTAREEEQK